MKAFILVLISIFFTTQSFSQSAADKFVGTWDGFGFVENAPFDFQEGCIERLVIEKIPNSTDSVKCSFLYIPTNGQEYWPSHAEASVYNFAIKDGYLINTFSDPTGFSTEHRLSLIKEGNTTKIHSKHSLKSKGTGKDTPWFLNSEHLYVKANFPQKGISFFRAMNKCCEQRTTSIPINDGPESKKDEHIRNELNNKARVKCLLQNIDLSKFKLFYLEGIGILSIEVQGLTPIHVLLNPTTASEIIKGNRVKFDFKEIDVSYEDDEIGYIIPRKVDLFFEESDLFIQYPQPEFLFLSWKKLYPDYIRSGLKKDVKSTK